MKHWLRSLLVLALIETSLAQTSPLWGNLIRGPYGVGFEELNLNDNSRSFNGKPRPMQLCLWSPSQPNQNPSLRSRNYFEMEAREVDFLTFPTTQEFDSKFFSFMGRHGATKENLRVLLQTTVAAKSQFEVQDQPLPLVIFVQGGSRPTWSAFILCEYLASHGFYVATMPNIGLHRQKNDGGSLQHLLQVEDIQFVKGYLSSRSGIDCDRLGLISFSKGAEALYLYQMKNRNARALVTLDGIPDTVLMKQSPFYFADQINIPILSIQSNHGAHHTIASAKMDQTFNSYFPRSDKTALRFMQMNHPDLLSTGMMESILVPNLTRFKSIGDVQTSHELMCQIIKDFMIDHVGGGESRDSEIDTTEAWVVHQFFPGTQ